MVKQDGKQDLNNNDDEGLMPKKSCQRYKDSYQDTWNFICASKKGETFFHCTVCAIDIACAHGGKSDVRLHVGTKNHIDLAKVKQNCRSMKTFIISPNMTNSEIDLRKAVTKSETIMCQLIVNLIIFLVKRCSKI